MFGKEHKVWVELLRYQQCSVLSGCFTSNYSLNRYVACTFLHVTSNKNLSVTLQRFISRPLHLATKEEGQLLAGTGRNRPQERSGPHGVAHWCTPCPCFN